VQTPDDSCGEHEFPREINEKKNNNFAARYAVMESPGDVIRNLAIRLPSFLIAAPEIALRARNRGVIAAITMDTR